MKKVSLLLSILFLTQIVVAGEIKKTVSSRYGYIENKGQIIDQNNNLNPAVKFLFNGNGLNVQLKANSFSYDTYTIERIPKKKPENESQLPDKFKMPDEDIIYHFHRIDIEFIGANKSPEIIAEQPSEDYTNYYTTGTPEEGVTFVRTYQKVTYRNLYEGIDLEFSTPPKSPEGGLGPRDGNSPLLGRGAGGEVKYNFIIHPGADASQIKWKYNGAFNTSLKDGKIILTVEQGNIEEKLPESFINETSQKINVNYSSLDNNVFSFSIPDYNLNSTLVIDPVPWVTYYGGGISDDSRGITSDIYGNIYITGSASSTSGIATSGSFQSTIKGGSDGYFVKFNMFGVRLWGTYFGGISTDAGYFVNIDIKGGINISGYTNSTTFISTTGAFQPSIGGGVDAIIAKFDSTGIRQWSTYFGGPGNEYGNAITSDRFCNLILTGWTNSSSAIASTGSFQSTFIGGGTQGFDGYFVKFDSAGSRIFSSYYGGYGSDWGIGIATDSGCNILLAGYTESPTGIATSGSYQSTIGSTTDAYLAKFNPLGVRLWATYYGGTGNDLGRGVVIDANANIYLAGYTYSSSNIATIGAFQNILSGTTDNLLVKFNSSGVRQWATYSGGNGYDNCEGIAIDSFGNLTLTGQTSSSSGFATTGAFQTTFGGGSYDAYITKFDSMGGRLWCSYIGANGNDYGLEITTNIYGDVLATGYTFSTTGLATSGAYQTTFSGTTAAFVASFTSNGGLPVQLISFNANMKEDDVKLTWQTASELNNDHFEIERSVQSAQCLENCWDKIGTAKGKGTTSAVSDYLYTDKMLKQVQHDGTSYYRLKQIDVDGKFEYSKIVSVSFDKASATDIIVSPNPNNGVFDITLPNIANTNIEVFDILGNKVHAATLNSSAQLNLSQLNKGIYFLKCVSENGMQTKKVVIE